MLIRTILMIMVMKLITLLLRTTDVITSTPITAVTITITITTITCTLNLRGDWRSTVSWWVGTSPSPSARSAQTGTG
jgi:hypothetical protein